MTNVFVAGLISSLASAPLLAQTGTAKTAAGWAVVLLCIGLGLLVVCRPSIRNPAQKKPVRAKKK
jgi:hypothetical protein